MQALQFTTVRWVWVGLQLIGTLQLIEMEAPILFCLHDMQCDQKKIAKCL